MQLLKSDRIIKVFIGYSYEEREIHDKILESLGSLEYAGEITIWQDLEISPGTNWEDQIHTHLHEADLILLLVSASFIASKYCWSKEVLVALERHQMGMARVIPIILKPTDWQNTPLGQLQALPAEAKPITQWEDRDAALDNVVRGIRAVVKDLRSSLQESGPSIEERPSLQRPPDVPGRRIARHRFPHLGQALLLLLCAVILLVGSNTIWNTVIQPKYGNVSETTPTPTEPYPTPVPSVNTSPIYFAPYQDMTLPDAPSLQSVMKHTGQKFYVLAYIDSGIGTCNAEWGDSTPFNQTKKLLPHFDSDLRYIRSHGGDVVISFGGSPGQEDLALNCQDAVSLQAQYQRVIDTYHVTHLDFDIEEGNQADVASYTRRNIAIAGLQKANPHLSISFTLPAVPAGLPSDSFNLLQDAKAEGVKISIVNLLEQDFGAPDNDMGQDAIDGATAVFHQIQQIFPDLSDNQAWAMLGTTVMIGQNDSPGEIFTEPQAQHFVAFAKQMKMGYISFWEVSRDNGNCAGQTTAWDTCSGLSQGTFDFVKIFRG